MDINILPSNISKEETLNHLSKFVRGSTGEQSASIESLIKSALLLLQTLPATRLAVLHYIAGIYDNAVKEHFKKLDASEHMQTDVKSNDSDNGIIDDIQSVFMSCIRSHPDTWGPILSSWSLECLGKLSSKYGERHTMPRTSSLNELLLMWMSCPASRSLSQITFACFESISDADAGTYVNALLEASVKHSPHFDWIVAHIGSCFPQTIINRVLLCGLTDFHTHSSSETSASIADSDLQKMPSVAGILSHLATQHGESVRQAMWAVVKTSLEDEATAVELTGPAYLLDLAFRSPMLLHAATDVFLEHVTVDVLNKVAVLYSQQRPTCIQDVNKHMGLIVHLLMKNDHNSVKLFHYLLHCASNGASCSSDCSCSAYTINPLVQQYSSVVLNRLELEMQRATNCRSKDLSFEIPLLQSMKSHDSIVELCKLLNGTSHIPSIQWLNRLLTCIALHCGEASAVDVLSEILATISDVARLNVFVKVQRDIQAKYPDIISSVVSNVVASLAQSCISGVYKGNIVVNLTQLCQWQTATENQSITRCSITEVLCRHVDSLTNCLRASSCDVAPLLQLLCLLTIPAKLDVGRLTRIATRLVSCFFRSLNTCETNEKFTSCQRCVKCLGRISDNNSSTQADVLRQLVEGCLSAEYAPLFGGVVTNAKTASSSCYRSEKPTSMLLNENQALENQQMASGTLMFHSGVIGQGLKSLTIAQSRPASSHSMADITHNRQLLLEALWTCSCRRLSNRMAVDMAAPTTPSLDTERRFPAEVAKHLAIMLVELVTPDVMFNDITWPEEEMIHVTIERDLLIWRRFDENPVLWDIMDFVSTGMGAMKYCSCLLRGVMATLINQWECSRENSSKDHPKLLETSCRVIEFMRKGQILPEPLCYTGDILQHVSPYEVYLLLMNIWAFIKDNAPLPGTRVVSGCASRYTELIHTIFQNNISQLSHLCLLLYPPITAKSQTVTIPS